MPSSPWDETESSTIHLTLKTHCREFPGGPVVRTLGFHC